MLGSHITVTGSLRMDDETRAIRYSSNARAYVALPAFQQIIALGPGAIPLARAKLITNRGGDFMLAPTIMCAGSAPGIGLRSNRVLHRWTP